MLFVKQFKSRLLGTHAEGGQRERSQGSLANSIHLWN